MAVCQVRGRCACACRPQQPHRRPRTPAVCLRRRMHIAPPRHLNPARRVTNVCFLLHVLLDTSQLIIQLKITLCSYSPSAHEELPPSSTETPGTAQLKPVTAVSQLTVASAPVRSAPAQSSYALERRVPKHDHHHRPVETVQPVQVKLLKLISNAHFRNCQQPKRDDKIMLL